MTKNNKNLSTLLMVALLSLPTNGYALLPLGLSSDIIGDSSAAGTSIAEQVHTQFDRTIKKLKENLTERMAKYEKYHAKRENQAEKVPGMRGFSESSVDIYDSEAVKAAFTELFLQYPSEDSRMQALYEKEAREFYYDTLIEVQTAAEKMEQQISSLRDDLNKFEVTAIKSDGISLEGAASSEDENGVYYNLYLAHKKYNDVLKLTEEVMALYSQYYVARMLYYHVVLPAPYEEQTEEEKVSSVRVFSENMAFAQFINNSMVAKTDKKAAVKVDKDIKISKYYKVDFDTPAAPKPRSSIEGNEKELEDLGVIAKAQTQIDEAIETHNLIHSLPSYRYLFQQYEIFKEMHQKAVEAVKYSDKCVVKYLGRHYTEPNKVWYGTADIPADFLNYDKRRGISGWAISAYQIANTQKSNGLDLDSFATMDITKGQTAESLEDLEKISQTASEMNEKDALTSPGDFEDIEDATREIDLLTWQIGAEAAKILAEDQNSSHPVYGQASKPYPLWQDQKSFYNQYIDGKYENMKEYIRRLDLNDVAIKIAEVINDSQEKSKEKEETRMGLSQLSAYLEKQESKKSNSENIITNKKKALFELGKIQQAALSQYENPKNATLSELNKVAMVVDSLNQEIQKADQEVLSGKSERQVAQKQLKYMKIRNTPTDSNMYIDAAHSYITGYKKVSENEVLAQQLRKKVKVYEERRDKLNQKLEALQKDIQMTKDEYASRAVAIEKEYNEKQLQAENHDKSSGGLLSLITKLKIKGMGIVPVVTSADGLMDDVKNKAIQMIEAARRDIYSLGGGLYDAKNNSAVVKRHQELIADLKKLPEKQFIQSAMLAAGGNSVSAITSLASGALISSIDEKICNNVSCNQADSRYFVGFPAKTKDFTAPKAPEFEHQPAVRDVVHFDVADYKNIAKTKDGGVSKNAILEYGATIPEIWKQILADDAFVERGLNLDSLMERGGEAKTFMRGVYYPCRQGKDIVDVDADDEKKRRTTGKYLVSKADSKDIPICKDIILMGANSYYTIKDLELDKTESAGTQKEVEKFKPSELGTLFTYEDNQLKFNPTSYAVYERLVKLEKKAEKKGFEMDVRDNVYQKATYNRNQIGNFLHFVDKEIAIRKNLNEMKITMDDARNNIKKMLEESGFKVANNFNLAKDEDYEYIRSKLNAHKNNMIGAAASDLSVVNEDNPVVKERYDKVNNTRIALIQDKDAFVALDSLTASGSALEEQIRREKVDLKVMKKSQSEGFDALRKEIENYEKPLCVAY